MIGSVALLLTFRSYDTLGNCLYVGPVRSADSHTIGYNDNKYRQ